MTGINAAELRNVCKVRKDFKIDNVSFKLPSGTITGFVGENGAGKTTVIELILDIIKRDCGEILVFGMDNITHRSEIHEDIGVVFDTVKFPDTLTACDLNKIMSGIYKNWDEDEFVGYCARFALPIDKKFARFSRGMTMKLSLAAAFSHKAKLLILDEPTGGLDPAARNEILDIIQEFVCDEEHTVLFSSHITGDLERIADRIVFIRGGRIIFSEDTIELSETRAVAKFGEEDIPRISPEEYTGLRKTPFGCEALVTDRRAFAEKYPDIMLCNASVEDIIVFSSRGVK